jgi:homoserine O-acetyltransferase
MPLRSATRHDVGLWHIRDIARSPAWTVTVLEATRKAIMLDPAWKNSEYDAPPEQGIRLWRDILNFLAARSPEVSRDQFDNPLDILRYLQAQETGLIKAFDANDWIYQTWAYEKHDIGTTPGFNGDATKALRVIKAKTLILVGTKDLLNPEWEPVDAARFIRDVRVTTISLGTVSRTRLRERRFPRGRRFPQSRNLGIFRLGDRPRRETEIVAGVDVKEPRKQVQSLTGISQAATQRSHLLL